MILTKDMLKEMIVEEWVKVDKKKSKSTRERKRQIFPGYEEIDKLSYGITEIEEDEDDIDDQEELEEKREKKKNCTPGNPYFDKKGRFTNPNKEGGSWSIANKSSKSGCKKGKARRPSGRQEKFTKLPCGRLDVDSPNKKAPNKCKGLDEQDHPSEIAVDVPHDLYAASKKIQNKQHLINKLKKNGKEW